MTNPEGEANQPPCMTSSLHLPAEVDGMFNAARFENVPGDCTTAAEAIRVLGLPEAMIQKCPTLLEDYKAKGAPQEVTCIAKLMLLANATAD